MVVRCYSIYGNQLETCTGKGITGIPRDFRGIERVLRGSHGDGNCGTPAGMENILRDSRGMELYLTFMVHLHQQVN